MKSRNSLSVLNHHQPNKPLDFNDTSQLQ
jgi:hypothetical protein